MTTLKLNILYKNDDSGHEIFSGVCTHIKNNKYKNMKEKTQRHSYERSIKIIRITAAILGGIAIISGLISLIS